MLRQVSSFPAHRLAIVECAMSPTTQWYRFRLLFCLAPVIYTSKSQLDSRKSFAIFSKNRKFTLTRQFRIRNQEFTFSNVHLKSQTILVLYPSPPIKDWKSVVVDSNTKQSWFCVLPQLLRDWNCGIVVDVRRCICLFWTTSKSSGIVKYIKQVANHSLFSVIG